MGSSTIVTLALCFVTAMAGRVGPEQIEQIMERFLIASDGAHIAFNGQKYKAESTELMTPNKSLTQLQPDTTPVVQTVPGQVQPGMVQPVVQPVVQTVPVTGGTVNPATGQQEPVVTEVATQETPPACPHGRVRDLDGECFKGCPENSVSMQPSSDGNCECQENYLCFDTSVTMMSDSLEKELKPNNSQVVHKIVHKDQADKPAGCSMNAGGEGHVDATNVNMEVSQVKFVHHCEACACKAAPKSDTPTLRLHVPLAVFAVSLVSFSL